MKRPQGLKARLILARSQELARLGIATEEALLLPLRALIAVGYAYHHGANDLFVFGCRSQVYRLIQIIGGRVISLGQPVFENLLLG